MHIFVNTVESLNSPVYSAPPCIRCTVKWSVLCQVFDKKNLVKFSFLLILILIVFMCFLYA